MRLARAHVLVGVDDEARLAGVDGVLSALRTAVAELGLESEVQVIETGSLGVSGHGIVLAVQPDGVYYAHVTPADARTIVEEHLLKGRPVARLRLPTTAPVARPADVLGRQTRVVLANCGIIDPESIEEYIAQGGYEALGTAVTELAPEAVLDLVKRSGLRGRGGAGFPTGIKWSAVRTAADPERYVVCNADEGEPGTFKDRLILEGDPHKLLEGMALAGYAVGAHVGIVYIRGEYGLSIARTQRAIAQAEALGILGDRVFDTDFAFRIEVRPGAGAYVCGEETALLESLEGKRGWPRMKPPYPVTHGLWGKPTVVNNVETLANVPDIVRHGPAWYRALGTATCPGTKVYTILGNVRYSGLVEVEMGTPLRALIYELGGGLLPGRSLKGVLVGGAAGAFLPTSELDVRLDFDSLAERAAALGSGAVLVLDESACVVDMLSSVLRFFRHESCGQCAPCRSGTDVLVRLVSALQCGQADDRTLNQMVSIVDAMRAASLCPLGQSVALPVRTAVAGFRDEFAAHLGGPPCARCEATAVARGVRATTDR
ncbi:MAG: NADH-ubiquinone oxidoreductase chain F [Candidatus Bipolaricaulis sibiricus]|uniref:NADH-ubiquinone oxidoreductase chain F n=1 Tax=Bipolaricaulis sibiricus TaxID=2501609 RepID=A0A410FV61_BIPS1|nr:MAG: NADH-ubiquinone oxidoreductase chain F [Candidatus Bipolaricaulis sibiricus]